MARFRQPSSKRRLRRFICSEKIISTGQSIELSLSETNHLKNVIRMKPGSLCIIVDGQGMAAEAAVKEYLENGRAMVNVEKLLGGESEHEGLCCHVYIAVPQKGIMDDLVEKCQELGIERIQPLDTRRTVIKMAAEQKKKALARWERIAKSAMKQSGALSETDVAAPLKIEKCLADIPEDEKIVVFHPDAKGLNFGDWINELASGTKGRPIHLFFGPEGGFDEREIELFKSFNASVVYLGERTLRLETAVLSVLGALRLLW